MNCPSCGHPNREGAGFCGRCGNSLAADVTCASCGATNDSSNAFCDVCGRSLAAPAPSEYTPAHLAEKILEERPGLQGERRTVTALFADAVGSTPIGERVDAEDVYALMQGCVQRMMDAVHHYEGHVVQFRGDGIMALFGAPIAHEDAARRAVVAGLDMQAALDEYCDELRSRGGPWEGIELRFRVGLNTGPVVVGGIGDDLHMDFTAIGDTVNLAARMESAAEPGSVLITEATMRVVEDYIECEPIGNIVVKGKSQPISAYRAIREKGVKTRFEAATSRGLTEYVGRSEELSVLQRYLGRSAQGQGQVVLVSGEAGIGKSRLLLEFRRSLGQDVRWIEGHCISYGRGIPYLPVIDVLKSSFGVEETDDEGRIIERIDRITADWLPVAQKTVPYLKFLLAVDPGDASIEHMDPVERRAGVLDGLRALALQDAMNAPLVITIEDMHWADAQSAEAIGALVDVVRGAPILLILTYRPGYTHALADLPHAHRVVLDHLPADESIRVATNVLHKASLPNELMQLIVTKAEGNPFFIEEVTKGLVEASVLEQAGDKYQLRGSLDDVLIPDSIQEVILSRIDRLEREAKQAIQLASVIGREFTVKLLDRISGMHVELESALGQLKSLELIYEKSFFPEIAYMFKHALTHDVAYSTLLVERRKSLHHIVAMAIEELYADRLSEQYETLAFHYEQGEVWENALDYLERSGDKAAGSYANTEAVDFYSRALAVCDRIGPQAGDRVIAIAEKRGFVAISIALVADAIASFDRMRSHANDMGDTELEGRALSAMGMALLLAHQFDRAEETLREALAVGGAYESVRYFATVFLVLLLRITDRHDEAVPLEPEVDELDRRVDDPFVAGYWREFTIIVPNWQGRFDTALAQDLPDVTDDQQVHVVVSNLGAYWTRGLALGGSGRYEDAIATLRQVITIGERIGDIFYRIRSLNTLGWVYGEIEDLDEAWVWNSRCIEEARKVGFPDPEIEFNARLNIADILLAQGRGREAEEHFVEIEEVFRNPTMPDKWMLWRYSLHLLHSYGELWLDRGDTDRALSYADECIAGAVRSSSLKYVVKGQRLRGQDLLARGDDRAASDALHAALEAARELGNPPQLWKTLATLGDHREAASVIADVASRLSEQRRTTFLASERIRAITDLATTKS